MRRVPFFCIVVILLALWLAPAALAVDGVIEIDQDKALAGSVTSTDTPGFPVTIDAPGSYRLTSDLTLTSTTLDAVDIVAEDVSLDLGGFAISGPSVCSGTPISCTPLVFGEGVEGGDRIQVANGTIQGMGNGLLLGSEVVVRNVRVLGNSFNAIDLQDRSILSDSVLSRNGSYGAVIRDAALVTRVVASGNGGAGIVCGAGCIVREASSHQNIGGGVIVDIESLVTDSSTSGNTGDGIHGMGRAAVFNNTANGNTGEGIELWSIGAIIGNTASSNNNGGIQADNKLVVAENATHLNGGPGIELGDGNSVFHNATNGNTGSGIEAGSGNAIVANTARSNGSATGITTGANSGVANNVLTGNGGGEISGSYHQTDANVCGTNLVCP